LLTKPAVYFHSGKLAHLHLGLITDARLAAVFARAQGGRSNPEAEASIHDPLTDRIGAENPKPL
jgi:hypothetical protein